MSRFSVIVPTHEVAGRLADCLDSVLAQSCADFELLAVVGEPDGPGAELVAEYARRDARIRVLHSPPGAGLAGARNAGLAAARGEFVLFLDGDDTFVPGAFEAVDERLAATGEPDLLLFDHERTHWFEGAQGPALGWLWRGAPEGAFELARHAVLPDVRVPAWSGAYRREFVRRAGLTFAAGWFTDLPWSVLAALRAERIAVLDRVCVRHLLRRQGARTEAPGLHHLELLERVDELLAEVAGMELPSALHAAVFRRVMDEVGATAGSPSRLPSRADRRRFARRAGRLYRRHRPAGFVRPGGAAGRRHALLAAGLCAAYGGLVAAGARAARPVRWLRVRAARAKARLTHPYRRFLRRPVDENLAVYSAYWGRGYTCNPAAVHGAARRLAPHVSSVFLVAPGHEAPMPEDVEPVVIGSRRYWEVMATAKYTFNNVNFEPRVRKRPGTVHVQTQHGTPLKLMGVDQAGHPASAAAAGPLDKLVTRVGRWDFNLSANRHSTEVWERAYPGSYESLDVGYPRNDAFYTATAEDVVALRRRFGIPDEKIALLYAPTHRDHRTGFASQLDLAEFCAALGEEFVVLLRAHHLYEGSAGLEQALRSGTLIDLTAHRSPEEVCLAADALITDYSSIMFDYANLDRPIVIYADDWEVYRETRGVYFDLLAEPPGCVARTAEELAEVFRSGAWEGADADRLRAAFRARFCDFDDGLAAARVVRRVMLGQPAGELPPVVPLSRRVPAPAPPRRASAAGRAAGGTVVREAVVQQTLHQQAAVQQTLDQQAAVQQTVIPKPADREASDREASERGASAR
ncbi:bifunctional glycosyltransferase/CDP-glycerol:glycerophosphate glycerophosphotransferase [Streptomyces indicus]|uniref:CDP-glycerol glycerophosphotransferase, TagB/SpsB family n=1 Tax=Streptomyces indicus TaxID=417292 RepID=A0A1G9E016_9ACTN|nr:bifunctional glycosyltransferase family 2 protein/CDP-glycerol:glycerophosphate glycerophosphotransferase [Streptomyces indicus]SDK69449.1 CDP-glycerol glycerophosphotransferase, TagB/SpsB family [Streptomyces indicus]